jgi:hypothetical protein
MKRLIIFVLFSLSSSLVYSSTYDCKVTRKFDLQNEYTPSILEKYKYSVKIKDTPKPELERCSFVPSQNKVTCDRYLVDRVETDKFVGIKKFYYFTGQFDVQLYPDMRFLENNGRGGISYGSCVKL